MKNLMPVFSRHGIRLFGHRRSVLGTLLVCLPFLTCVAPDTARGQADNKPGASVVVSPEKQTHELLLEGTVEAVKQATMSAQVSGQVVELNFDVNDYVTKGQVLLRIKGEQREAGVALAKAGVDEAKAALAQASSEHARLKQLFDKQMVTSAKMDAAVAAMSAAQARLKAAQAQVSGASETAGDNVVKAPYSGYVLERFVQLGETANIGHPIFSGMSLDELRVMVTLPQSAEPVVRKHMEARVLLADGSSIPGAGVTLFPYADKGTHTVGARIKLPNETKGLFPGMLVKVAFKLGERERLLIPATAMVQRSEVTGIYLMGAQGQVSFRRVLAGRQDDKGRVEVLAGLVPGERIALDPVMAGLAFKASPQADDKEKGTH